MKKYSIILISILALTIFNSCSDDDENVLDNEKPTINISEPEEDETFEVGGELHFEVDFADNVALSSYKVDIHNNFDGHTHSSSVLNSTATVSTKQTEITPWSLNETHDIEGNPTEYNVHEHIDIPANIAEGPYHLGITVVDAAGNQNQVYVQFIVGEDHTGEEHGINITDIEVEDVAPGAETHAEAQISAEHGIATVSVNIHGHDITPAEGEEEWEFEANFDDYSGNSATFHEHIDIPATAPKGEYHLSITVIDEEGNSHAEGFHFHITDADNDASAITISDMIADEEVKAGEELHLEASIAGEHGVEEVAVHIHFEGDTEGWEYEEAFPYEDQSAVNFQEHFAIPAEADLGEYHLSLEVTDHEGNTSNESVHFDVVE